MGASCEGLTADSHKRASAVGLVQGSELLGIEEIVAGLAC